MTTSSVPKARQPSVEAGTYPAWFFVPAALVFGVLFLAPMLSSFYFALTRWTLQTQLAGKMPTLPAENSALRNALIAHRGYMDRLMALSDQLGAWIVQAQQDGAISRLLPPEAVLYTIYARACDPVLGFLKAGGSYNDEQIVDMVMLTCFDGLSSRP